MEKFTKKLPAAAKGGKLARTLRSPSAYLPQSTRVLAAEYTGAFRTGLLSIGQSEKAAAPPKCDSRPLSLSAAPRPAAGTGDAKRPLLRRLKLLMAEEAYKTIR